MSVIPVAGRSGPQVRHDSCSCRLYFLLHFILRIILCADDNERKPPKISLANGFARGYIPQDLNLDDLSPLEESVCALLRPKARITLHTQSGCKSVKGSVLLLAADPGGVARALEDLRSTVLPVPLEQLAFRVVLAGPFDSNERVSTLRRYPFRVNKVYGEDRCH